MTAAVDAIEARIARATMLETIVANSRATRMRTTGSLCHAQNGAGQSLAIYEKASRSLKHLGAHEYIGEAYLALGELGKAKEHLARLNKLCFLGCEQYRDLKKAVEAYEKSGGKIRPAAAN